jgi:hypothetical protein
MLDVTKRLLNMKWLNYNVISLAYFNMIKPMFRAKNKYK